MDALKKFIQKKKTDKVFKGAGPGQTVGNKTSPPQGSSSKKSSGSSSGGKKSNLGHGHTVGGGGGASGGGGGAASGAAAAAALARLDKCRKPGAEVDEDKLRAARQIAFIKERARKELEAERKKDPNAQPSQPVQEEPEARRTTDPRAMAVSGVYFTCPLISPEILSKEEIEHNIKSFLIDQPEQELAVTACLLIHSCNKPFEKVINCVETLGKYITNIVSNPEEPKFRKIRCSNKVFQDKVLPVLGFEQFLKAAGFHKTRMQVDGQDEEFWVFQPEDETTFVAHLTELRDMLKETSPIKPELDRNLQVLVPAQVSTRRDLPDEFYNLNLSEVKREQQTKTETAEKELMLRTKAMKERDELREQRLYKYGVMRVRFPDGLTLQGTFKATEKLSELYTFVQENLIHDANINFYLVRSGGESLVQLDATLAELKLTPASILNFKVESAPAALATGEISFLNPDILALVKSM